MESAFTYFGNHLISDLAAAIWAGVDDLSTIDLDKSLLYSRLSERWYANDKDNQTEAYNNNDNNSLMSIPITVGIKGLALRSVEDKRELPAYTYIYIWLYLSFIEHLLTDAL